MRPAWTGTLNFLNLLIRSDYRWAMFIRIIRIYRLCCSEVARIVSKCLGDCRQPVFAKSAEDIRCLDTTAASGTEPGGNLFRRVNDFAFRGRRCFRAQRGCHPLRWTKYPGAAHRLLPGPASTRPDPAHPAAQSVWALAESERATSGSTGSRQHGAPDQSACM